MGLTMIVGLLADLKDSPEDVENLTPELKKINKLLVSRNLPEHHEPMDFPEDDENGYWNFMIHYGCVEKFVEAIRKCLEDGSLNITKKCAEHLLKHSAGDGCWVPIDFEEIIVVGEDTIGSSYRLKEICEAMAPLTGLPMPLAEIPLDYSGEGEELGEFMEEALEGKKLGLDAEMCVVLYQAATISINNKMALFFG